MVPNSSDAAVKRCLGFGQYETVPSGAVEFKLEGIHKICGAVVEIANKEKQKNQGSHVASSAVNPEVPNEKKAKEIPTESKKFWLGGVKAGGLKITKGANKEVNHFYPEGPYTEAKGRYYTLFISTQNGYFHLGISGINFKNSYCTIQLRSEKISSPISDIIVPGTTWKLELLSYETWEDSDTETVAMHWTAPQKTMDLSCSLKDGFTTTDHLKLINEILKPILEISRK